MNWIDIACIVFACTTASHLGLVAAIEGATKRELPVIRCPKCFSFWAVMAYGMLKVHDIVAVPAVSFLAAYLAIWLELAEGFIDTLYNRLYEQIYTTADTADADTPGA